MPLQAEQTPLSRINYSWEIRLLPTFRVNMLKCARVVLYHLLHLESGQVHGQSLQNIQGYRDTNRRDKPTHPTRMAEGTLCLAGSCSVSWHHSQRAVLVGPWKPYFSLEASQIASCFL